MALNVEENSVSEYIKGTKVFVTQLLASPILLFASILTSGLILGAISTAILFVFDKSGIIFDISQLKMKFGSTTLENEHLVRFVKAIHIVAAVSLREWFLTKLFVKHRHNQREYDRKQRHEKSYNTNKAIDLRRFRQREKRKFEKLQRKNTFFSKINDLALVSEVYLLSSAYNVSSKIVDCLVVKYIPQKSYCKTGKAKYQRKKAMHKSSIKHSRPKSHDRTSEKLSGEESDLAVKKWHRVNSWANNCDAIHAFSDEGYDACLSSNEGELDTFENARYKKKFPKKFKVPNDILPHPLPTNNTPIHSRNFVRKPERADNVIGRQVRPQLPILYETIYNNDNSMDLNRENFFRPESNEDLLSNISATSRSLIDYSVPASNSLPTMQVHPEVSRTDSLSTVRVGVIRGPSSSSSTLQRQLPRQRRRPISADKEISNQMLGSLKYQLRKKR